MAELVAAGIEGGSKRRVEEEWGLEDYREQLAYWRRSPPPHISLAMIAEAHGARFEKSDEDEGPRDYELAPAGLSIAEISERITPLRDLASDSTAPSREALRLLHEAPAP